MKAAEDNAVALQQHMASTYHNLRMGIALIGAILPLLLWIGGLLGGERLQGSMSAYYFTHMRDVFVGSLITIGFFLYLYKGFSTKENWALNLAGVLAAGIALVATAMPGSAPTFESRMHKIFAVSFFLCIAYVAVFRASDTLSLINDPQKKKQLALTYRALGIAMIVSPLLAVVLTYLLERTSLTFYVEALAVWFFAAYWLVKGREIRETEADALALAGKLQASEALKKDETPGQLHRLA